MLLINTLTLTLILTARYFLDRWPFLADKLPWDITTTQVNSALHPPEWLNRVPAFAGVKPGKSLLLGGRKQCVILWHVISRSGVVISTTCHPIYFSLLYNVDERRNGKSKHVAQIDPSPWTTSISTNCTVYVQRIMFQVFPQHIRLTVVGRSARRV